MLTKSLAIVVFFMSATAVEVGPVRLADIAFGLGFIAIVAIHLFRISTHENTEGTLVGFLVALILSCIVSWLIQLAFANIEVIEAGYANAVIVPCAIIFTILLILSLSNGELVKLASETSLIFSALLVAILLWWLFFPQPTWLKIDYEATYRFSALSLNPNQLALVLLPLPFFSYLGWKYNRKPRLLALSEAICAFTINGFCFGKALFVAWMFGLALPIYIDAIINAEKHRFFYIFSGIAGAPVILLAVFQVLDSFYAGRGLGSIEGQGENRLAAWTNGLLAWKDAFLFGHGPGAFSGVYGPYEHMECHNTLIDWATGYGLIGVVLLISFFGFAFKKAFESRDWSIAGYFFSLVVQSFFHFYGRQPFYWVWWTIGFAFVATAAARREKSSFGGRRSAAVIARPSHAGGAPARGHGSKALDIMNNVDVSRPHPHGNNTP
jgi:hypothetical protein